MKKNRFRKFLIIPNFAILIASLFLSGCATMYNAATGRNEVIFIDSQTEFALGKNVSAELVKEHAVLTAGGLYERAERVGRRIAAVSDRKDVEYTFFVLDDKELNAVSLPGGFIYVNKGLISVLNDDELAFVLGHEAGHVAARHAIKKIQATMAYQLLLGIAFTGMGNNTKSNAQEIQKAVGTVYNLVSLGYSREDEYQADTLGVKYAFHAGYNPQASLSALEKIRKEEETGPKILGYLRTHPYIDDRIAALKKTISQFNRAGTIEK